MGRGFKSRTTASATEMRFYTIPKRNNVQYKCDYYYYASECYPPDICKILSINPSIPLSIKSRGHLNINNNTDRTSGVNRKYFRADGSPLPL